MAPVLSRTQTNTMWGGLNQDTNFPAGIASRYLSPEYLADLGYTKANGASPSLTYGYWQEVCKTLGGETDERAASEDAIDLIGMMQYNTADTVSGVVSACLGNQWSTRILADIMISEGGSFTYDIRASLIPYQWKAVYQHPTNTNRLRLVNPGGWNVKYINQDATLRKYLFDCYHGAANGGLWPVEDDGAFGGKPASNITDAIAQNVQRLMDDTGVGVTISVGNEGNAYTGTETWYACGYANPAIAGQVSGLWQAVRTAALGGANSELLNITTTPDLRGAFYAGDPLTDSWRDAHSVFSASMRRYAPNALIHNNPAMGSQGQDEGINNFAVAGLPRMEDIDIFGQNAYPYFYGDGSTVESPQTWVEDREVWRVIAESQGKMYGLFETCYSRMNLDIVDNAANRAALLDHMDEFVGWQYAVNQARTEGEPGSIFCINDFELPAHENAVVYSMHGAPQNSNHAILGGGTAATVSLGAYIAPLWYDRAVLGNNIRTVAISGANNPVTPTTPPTVPPEEPPITPEPTPGVELTDFERISIAQLKAIKRGVNKQNIIMRKGLAEIADAITNYSAMP